MVSFNFTSNYLTEGRLEMYYNSDGRYSWMPFCYSGFSTHAANLACQQLGYSHANNYDTVSALRWVHLMVESSEKWCEITKP